MTAATTTSKEEEVVSPLISEPPVEGPYIGLRTYEEKDEKRYSGRQDVVAELAKLVKRGPLTVLFGVSGTGKSSLIGAGLFPALRNNELYLPIMVRLDFTTKLKPGEQRDLLAQIRDAITAQLVKYKVDGKRPDSSVSLRDYFARTTWWNDRNKLLTPFIVFDQFEEIFTVGRDDAEQVQKLMVELADLIERPTVENDGLEITPPRARVMLALREDFLAHLEDFRAKIPSLAANRYRLTRMNGAQALRAVVDPGQGIIDEETAKKVVRFVASGADSTESIETTQELELNHPLETLEVEPAILSLVCEQLDLQRRKQGLSKITVDLLKTQGAQIVESFYDNAFAKVPRKVRVLVEDKLVTNDGFRTTMAKADLYENPGVTPESIKALLDKKILREEVRFGSLHVELIHDRLATIASESRAHRRDEEREQQARKREAEREAERERRWRRRRWFAIIGGLAVLVALGGFAAYKWRAHKIEADRKHARDMASELAMFQLREARDSVARGDTAHAASLLVQAGKHFDDAKVASPPEVALLVERSALDVSSRVQVVDHGSEIDSARIVGIGTLMTIGRDSTLRVWPDRTSTPVLHQPGVSVARTFPSFSGEWALILQRDGSGDVRNASGTQFAFESPSRNEAAQQQTANPKSPLAAAPPGPAPPHPSPVPASPPPHEAAPVAAPASASHATTTAAKPEAKQTEDITWRACVAPDDKTFAVWSRRYPVRQWDVTSGKKNQSPLLAKLRALDVECLDNGRLAVLTEDNEILLLDESGADVTRRIDAYKKHVTLQDIAVSPDGRWIAFAESMDYMTRGVTLIDTAEQTASTTPIAAPFPEQLAFSRDGKLLIITSRGSSSSLGRLRLYDEHLSRQTFVGLWGTSEKRLRFVLERPDAVVRLIGEGNATTLVAASGKRLEAWNVSTSQLIGGVDLDFEVGEGHLDARLVAGRVLAAATDGPKAHVRIIDAPPWGDRVVMPSFVTLGPWITTRSSRDSDVNRMQVVAGQFRLEIGKTAITIRPSGKQLPLGDVADARISALPGDASHARIAVRSNDGTVTIYDEQFSPVATLTADPVTRIRWNDGGELLTNGVEQTQVWSRDGALRETLDGAMTAAAVIDGPPRVIWTCGVRCMASRSDTLEPLARADALSFVTSLDVSATGDILPVVIAGYRQLLPPIPAAGVAGSVQRVYPVGDDVIVTGENGTYVANATAPSSRLTASHSPPLNHPSGVLIADDKRLITGTVHEVATGQSTQLWKGSRPIKLVAQRDKRTGVVSEALDLSLVENGNLLKESDSAVQAAGAHAAFSDSGDRYALATARDTVEVRLTTDGSLVGAYKLAGQRVIALLVPKAPNKALFARTTTGFAYWSAPNTGVPPQVISGVYNSALIDPEGHVLVALRGDSHADIFQIDAAGLLKRTKTIPASAIAIDDKGTRLVVANGQKGIDVYGLGDLVKKNHHDLDAWELAITLSPRGGKYLWLPIHSELIKVFEHEGDVNRKIENASDCVFGGTGEFAACVFDENDSLFAQLVEIPSGRKVGEPVAVARPDRVIACSGHGDSRVGFGLVAGGTAKFLIWDPHFANARPLELDTTTFDTTDVSACRLGAGTAVTLSDSGVVETWNLSTTRVVTTLGGGRVADVAIDRAGTLQSAVLLPRQKVVLESLSASTFHSTDLGDTADVTLAAFRGDDELIAVSETSAKNEMRVWKVPLNGAPFVMEVGKGKLTALQILGPEHFVALGHEDGTVEVWTRLREKPPVVLPGHASAVRSIALDDSKKWVATSYDDGTVNVWTLSEGIDPADRREPLLHFIVRSTRPGAAAIAFGPGVPATALFTGGRDGEVRRWHLYPDARQVQP